MTRAVYGSLVTAALVVALGFRLAAPDLRPMHHDEANQALKFGALLETGEYRYDPTDHHGPTLYYLTLPVAWARGQMTLASLDERTLRFVPAIFGAGLLLLCPLLAGGLGRGAVVASAIVAALSPLLTYYSRFYIQESIFTFFTLGFLVSVGRYAGHPRALSALAVGLTAGLAYATKETAIIVLPTAVASVVLARGWTARATAGRTVGLGALRHVHHGLLALATAVAVAWLFYSSFFAHPAGFFDSIRGLGAYVERGVGTGPHAQPPDYYLRLLAYSASGGLVWTEGIVLVLALVGIIAAATRATPGFWPRYISLYTIATALIFSLIRYKTPWNALPFFVGCVLLAGFGASTLLRGARSRAHRGLVIVILVAAAAHLGAENWRANFRYPADPRNPYVYAHTSPDFLRLVRRVADLSALHADRAQMLVKVIAGPYEQWPLPWYLRRMTRVGYWTRTAEAGRLDGVPVMIASQESADAVGAALGDRYISEFYGLRPDVMLTVYIERSLWDRYLASVSTEKPLAETPLPE